MSGAVSSRIDWLFEVAGPTIIRVRDAFLDSKPTNIVPANTAASWVDYKVNIADNVSSSYWDMNDGDVLSSTILALLSRTMEPVVTAHVTLTVGNRTLAALPTARFRGQILHIVNNSSAYTLTINHGAGSGTWLAGGTTKVLSAGQSITFVANNSGRWRQIAAI